MWRAYETPKWAEAPDAHHSDKIAGLRGRIAERAEGGQSRAQLRRRLDGREIVQNGHEAGRSRDQHFGVSAVAVNAGEFLIAAVYEVASAAIFAITAEASEEAEAYAARRFQPCTWAPSASIRPTASWPGTRGQSIGNAPSTVPASEWHIPEASTRIRTSPGAGSRTGFRTSSSRPGAAACTAR
jgi:hypothetical protein